MSTYYVREENSSDGYVGSISAPFKTINKALSVAGNGDTIIVRGGVYREKINLTTANLLLKAMDGEAPVIRGTYTSGVPSFVEAGMNNDFDALVKMSASGCTFDGIDVENSAGRIMTMIAPNCIVKNSSWRNAFGAGVVQAGADNATMQNLFMSRMSQRGLNYGATFFDGTEAGKKITNHPHIVGPRSYGSLWENVTIMDGFGEGFSNYTGYGATWRNCKICDCTSPTVYVNWSPGLTIYNCEIYFTNEFRRARTGDYGETMSIGDETEIETRNKDIAGHSRDVHIYNNFFVGFGIGLSYGGDLAATKTWGRPANAKNIHFVGNTCIQHPNGRYALLINRMTYLDNDPSYPREYSGNRIENNIFVGTVIANNLTTRQINSFTIRNNYFSSAPPSWMTSGANTGNIVGGAHGLVSIAPPTLYAYGADEDAHDNWNVDNYKLESGSALRNAGRQTEYSQNDFYGTLRDSTPDIGAHEYTAGGAPSVTLEADFTLSANTVEEGTAVTLTDTSTISAGAIDAWDWDYRDINDAAWTDHSTSATPSTLTINTAGTYQIRLVVTDTDSSQSAQVVKTLTVIAAGGGEVGTCTGNLLSNEDFASGTTDWSFNAGTGGSGSFSAASGYADITVNTVSSTMQLYQNGFAITEGETYRLAFRAKSPQTRTVKAFLFDHTTIENMGVSGVLFPLTNEWAVYEHIFTAIASSSNVRLQMRPQSPTGSVQFDDFCIAPYTAPAGPEAIITVPSDPATVGVEQTLDSANSTGSPTTYSWKINGVEVGTSSTYAWTPTTQQTYTISLTVSNAYGEDETIVYVDANAPASGGASTGTVAALVTGAVPASTGAQAYDHADLGTAVAGVITLVSEAQTLGTAENNAMLGVGLADGTNGRSLAFQSQHNVADSNTRFMTDTAGVLLMAPTFTLTVDGDVALTDSDTLGITWNTISNGRQFASLRIAATNVAVGSFTPGGANVSLGWQPDVVFVLVGGNASEFSGSNEVGNFHSFGFITADGQRSLAYRASNGAASAALFAGYSQSYAGMTLAGGAGSIDSAITLALLPTGFSSSLSGSMSGVATYLALKLDGLQTQIIDFSTRTTTGVQSHSADFAAGAAVALMSRLTAEGTVAINDDADVYAIGLFDGTTERAFATSDDDGAATMFAKSHCDSAFLLVPSPTGGSNIKANVDAVTDTTFDLDYVAADTTARLASMLLIEAPSIAATSRLDYYQRGLGIGTVAGMP